MGTKKNSRRREPYEDLDTKAMNEEAVICEMYPHKGKPLTLKPFFTETAFEVYSLPQRVLLTIFDHIIADPNVKPLNELYSLAQVADEWRKLILFTPSLWKNLDLTDFDCKHTEKFLIELCENGVLTHVERISITGWTSPLTQTVLFKITTASAESLREVVLKDCSTIGNDLLQFLSEKCPRLTSVDLSKSLTHLNEKPQGSRKGGTAQNKPVQSSILQSFLNNCGPRLTQLNLAENTFKAAASMIKGIMDYCPNLQLLDLSNMDTPSNVAINVNALQLACPLIKILRLANIPLRTTNQNTNGFPDLEELSIPVNGQHEVGHNDSIIYLLTKTAENLKLLDIRGSKHVTVSCLVKIPAWNLQHLAISNCQHLYKPDLELVLKKWKHSLTEIDISWNNNDESVDVSLETLSTDENSSLSVVNLRGSSASFPAVKKLLLKCEKLQVVDLQSCRSLPRGIKRTFSGEELLRFKESVIQGHYD